MLFRLNRQYLNEEEYFTVLDQVEGPKSYSIGKVDYADDMQIMPIADPKASTERQRLARAEAEWAFLSQNPLVLLAAQSGNPLPLYNASRRYLEALQSQDIGEVLPDPQSLVPNPVRVDDQRAENMAALMGQSVPQVFPDQDHMEHIGIIDEFLTGAYASQLGEAALAGLNTHRARHVSFLYVSTETDLFDGQVGEGPLAPSPGDAGVPARPGGDVSPVLGGNGQLGPSEPPEGAL